MQRAALSQALMSHLLAEHTCPGQVLLLENPEASHALVHPGWTRGAGEELPLPWQGLCPCHVLQPELGQTQLWVTLGESSCLSCSGWGSTEPKAGHQGSVGGL